MKCQSISHIFTYRKDEINCTQRTLYYYWIKNTFTARNIDFSRNVKYKPKKKTTFTKTKESADRIGSTFDDFVKLIEDNPNITVVEMDTVHGTRSGRVLLTLLLRNCSLLLAFFIDSYRQLYVNEVIYILYKILGHKVFRRTFSVILTDNGSKFKNPKALELDVQENQEQKYSTATQCLFIRSLT